MDDLDNFPFKDETTEEMVARFKAQEEEIRKRQYEVLSKPFPDITKFEKLNQERFVVKSGFLNLDRSIKGFESRRTYVLGGLNKSGKSTFLMNILDNILIGGEQIGVIDTELGREDFIRRFAAISNRIHEYDDDNTKELQESWETVYLKGDRLQYAEKADILEQGLVSAGKLILLFDQWRFLGVRIFVIDNITTVQNNLVNNRAGYEVLRAFVEMLMNYAKEHNIILLLVLHTKGAELKFSESPERLNQIIEAGTPHKIFEKTATVNKRPSSISLYGGQSILSQVSGGIMLLWRPYQDFRESSYQRLTMLVLEDWRSKPKTFTNEIELDFLADESRYIDLGVGGGESGE